MLESTDSYDVLIVGAGPGGIAATVKAAEAGRRVCLIDEAPFDGGQIWRNRGELPKSFAARKWISRLNAVPNSITRLAQSSVVASLSSDTLLTGTPAGPRTCRGKSIILATGARELFLPFPGWTLPGVFGAGGIQALVKQGLPITGKRVIIAGTGPLLLAVAALLRSQGAIVPFILEQAPPYRINRFALSLLGSPSKLLGAIALRGQLLGTRYAAGAYPLRVAKTPGGLQLEFHDGRQTQSADCDYLACGFGLIPNNELAQLLGCRIAPNGFVRVDSEQRTSIANVFAVGEITGIGGVEKALLEGQIAALAAIGRLPANSKLARHHAQAIGFVTKLSETFALRPELKTLATPQTMICRCEDVPLSVIAHSLGTRDAKLQTRCGMGPCQGRVCGPILQYLRGTEPPGVRPPLVATSISTLRVAMTQNDPK